MEIHQVECTKCGNVDDLKYNGEHYLPPVGWVTLYDENQAKMLDAHLCCDCNPANEKPSKTSRKNNQ